MFTSELGCYGGGYQISTAACGEGTIDIYLGSAGNTHAHAHANAYAYAHTFALAYPNISDHSFTKSHAYASRCYHRESSITDYLSLSIALSPTSSG